MAAAGGMVADLMVVDRLCVLARAVASPSAVGWREPDQGR